MLKKIFISGLLGGIVLILWAFVANAILGFKSRIDMKQIPNESQVYQVLKENIVKPGGYMCNSPLTPAGTFPLEEQVFSIRYSGMGHASAAQELVVQLAMAIIAVMVAAWMLSVSSSRILSAYSRRVLFIAAIGLLFAVFSDLAKFGIGGYPLPSLLLLAANDFISWTLAGLVVAWWLKPKSIVVTSS